MQEETEMGNCGVWATRCVVSGVLLLAIAGCGGGHHGERTALDSVLIRTEALIAGGSDSEARAYLRGSYLTTPALWQGPSVPEGLRMLGELYQASAQFDSAFIFYAQSRAEFRNLAQRSRAYEMTMAIGSLHLELNRPQKARDLYEEALRLALVFDDANEARDLRWALVPVYAALEEPDNEQKLLALLLAEARANNDRVNEARVYYQTGLSQASRGEQLPAIDAFLHAVTLADQAKDSLLGVRILTHLALAFDAIGRGQDAVETFTTALQRTSTLDHNPDDHIALLLRIGNLHMRRNAMDLALQSYHAALPLAQQGQHGLAEATCVVQIAHATLRKDRTEALQLFRSGYDMFYGFGYKPGIAYALASLGDVAEREGRLTDALKLYEAASKAHEGTVASRPSDDFLTECETSALGPGGDDATAMLVSLLLQLGKDEEAFAVQQRKNARALTAAFGTWIYRTGNADVDTVLAESSRQRSVYCGAEREIERLVSSRPGNKDVLREIHTVLQTSGERMAEWEQEIQRRRPDLVPITGTGDAQIVDVQKSLPENTALLTFLPGRRSWYDAVITRNDAVVEVSSESTSRVVQAAQEYLQALRDRVAEADSLGNKYTDLERQLRNNARTLHEALVLPVEFVLKSGMRILVQFPPDMPAIPVHALRRGTSSGSPYLVERYDIQYVPSVQTITARTPAAGPVQSVTCVGFPGLTGWDVEYELRDVRYFFKDARMLFKRDAVLDTLRKLRSDVVHLSVEVQLGVKAPMLGGLILSDGVSPDGYRRVPFTALTGLPPNRLVFISNLSPLPRPLYPGLPFVFATNGSEGLIMNAVLPLRGAKKVFNEYFYTALQSGASPSDAFRTTQLQMIKDKDVAGPQYWAPFLYWRGR